MKSPDRAQGQPQKQSGPGRQDRKQDPRAVECDRRPAVAIADEGLPRQQVDHRRGQQNRRDDQHPVPPTLLQPEGDAKSHQLCEREGQDEDEDDRQVEDDGAKGFTTGGGHRRPQEGAVCEI